MASNTPEREIREVIDVDMVAGRNNSGGRGRGRGRFTPLVNRLVETLLINGDHSDYDPASEYDRVMNGLPFLRMNSRIGRHSQPVPGLPNHYLVYTLGDETVVGERIERFRHGQTLVLGREHEYTLSPFLRIIYFVEKVDKDGKTRIYAHCQVYIHARKTCDGNKCNEHEVHESYFCEDINTNLLPHCARIDILSLSREEFDSSPRAGNQFYCQTRTRMSSTSTSREETATPKGSFEDCVPPPIPDIVIPGLPQCPSCALRMADVKATEVSISIERGRVGRKKTTLRIGKVSIHVDDFIFFKPETTSSGLYEIGQVILLPSSISTSACVGVRTLKRWDDVAMEHDWRWKDEKLVFHTGIEQNVSLSRIVASKVVVLNKDDIGRCGLSFVRSVPNCFYLMEERPPIHVDVPNQIKLLTSQWRNRRCQECLDEWRAEEQADHGDESRNSHKLLSLFCGAGLADLGLVGNICDSHPIAVDSDEQARDSYQKFFPDNTYVTPKDVYRVVQEADQFKRILGSKPKLILITFPCQPFSRVNRNPKIDDERILLPFAALSVVDVVRPDSDIMECVSGLLHHRTKDMNNPGRTETGAVLGMIVRLLKDLGYQM
jgi:hypothetical protein